MKQLILVASLIIVSIHAYSQTSLGFTMGPQFIRTQSHPLKYLPGIAFTVEPSYRFNGRTDVGLILGFSLRGDYTSSQKYRLLQVMLNTRYFLTEDTKVLPYVGICAGYNMRTYSFSPTQNFKYNSFGLSPYTGLGIRTASGAGLFTVDVRYLYQIFKSSFLTNKIGSSHYGFTINVGLNFYLNYYKKPKAQPAKPE